MWTATVKNKNTSTPPPPPLSSFSSFMLHHLNPSSGCQPQDLQPQDLQPRLQLRDTATVLCPRPATCVCVLWCVATRRRSTQRCGRRRQAWTRGRRGRWTERRGAVEPWSCEAPRLTKTHAASVSFRTTRARCFTARSGVHPLGSIPTPPHLHLHAPHSLSSHSTDTKWAIKAFFFVAVATKLNL